MRTWKYWVAAGLAALCLGGAPAGQAAPQQQVTEAQEYQTGIHALKSEAGAYLVEHVKTDYFHGSFLTASDGRIMFPLQVLKDGVLLLEGCFITMPNGTESELMVLEADESHLPHFVRVAWSSRNAEVKTIMDTAYARTRQAEQAQLQKQRQR